LVRVEGMTPLAPPRPDLDEAIRDAYAHDVAHKDPRTRRPIMKDGYMIRQKQEKPTQQDSIVSMKLAPTFADSKKLAVRAIETSSQSLVALYALRFPETDWADIALRHKTENGVTTIWVEKIQR